MVSKDAEFKKFVPHDKDERKLQRRLEIDAPHKEKNGVKNCT